MTKCFQAGILSSLTTFGAQTVIPVLYNGGGVWWSYTKEFYCYPCAVNLGFTNINGFVIYYSTLGRRLSI